MTRQRVAILTSLVAILALSLVSAIFYPPGRLSPTPHAKPSHVTVLPVASRRKASAPKLINAAELSVFQKEQLLSNAELMRRWDPLVAEASKRFGVPVSWIRAVMRVESAGRTTLAEGKPIVSSAGAMGLMQLMPATYNEMRRTYNLGSDPFDPHDNIMAGAAMLRFLRERYGYPTMFAAYNDGPGNLEERLRTGGLLPAETRLYVATITGRLEGKSVAIAGGRAGLLELTRPDGSPILIDCTQVTAVRAALPEEYAPGVLTVVKVGKVRQGVREDVASVRAAVRLRGAGL